MTRFNAMRGVAMAALLATGALGVAAPAMAQATAAAARFDVPAGALGAGIARLGRQAGVVVTVDPALVRGKTTAGVSGQHGVAAALDQLLAGSGLVAQSDGRGGFRIVLAATSSSAPAVGGEAQEETHLFDPLVVVGALTDVEIDSETLELRQANDLSDLFRHVPSVTVGGSVGIAQKIYVRGLEDSMLNVTVDGAPQRGTLFHHIGRVSIEPELLQTVDVQAGAGEATAGFGAIGGAVRFRTKDADDLLEPGRNFGAVLKAGYFSNDASKFSGTVFGRLFGDIGFVASYVTVDRNDTKDGAGDLIRGTAAQQTLGYLKVGGEIAPGHRLSVSYEQRKEEARFGQRPNWPVTATNPLFPGRGERQTAVLNYGFSLGEALEFEATGYWTRSEFIQNRTDRWGLYGAEIDTFGGDLRGRFRHAGHDVVFGAEYRDDRVVSRYLGDPAVWRPWSWTAVGRFEEKGDVLGLYAQDHWRVNDRLLLSYGVRYDAYDLTQVTYQNGTDSDGFSFNAGLEYDITDELQLSAGYAEAFRGKEIGDAFTLEIRPNRISLAPNLKPETVANYELGLSFKRGGFSASAVYYNMTIDDVIFDQSGSGPPPQASVYYENIGQFKAEGVELRAGYRTGPWSIDGYYNSYDSTIGGHVVEGYEHVGLGTSVGDNWSLVAGYRPTPAFSFEASLVHYDDFNDLEVLQRAVEIKWIDSTRKVDKPGYTVVDLVALWRPFPDERLTLQAAVYNLFDKRYRAHSSVADYTHIPGWEGISGVYEPGRDVRLSVAYRF
ncbi:TonB-dependent receptor [Caulobacter mirabilis]|nr:TonB-dependent receptor [Caulobacter mirabilis]